MKNFFLISLEYCNIFTIEHVFDVKA